MKSLETQAELAEGLPRPRGAASRPPQATHAADPISFVLNSQRVYGNRITQRWLKYMIAGGTLPVGRPGDQHELEAESIAGQTARGPGAGDVRSAVGRKLGVNLSDARIHADSHSAEMNRALNAKAFTFGEDIFFGEGEYAPQSPGGRMLLAHELAHVAQQRHGGTPLIQRQPQTRVVPPNADTMRDYVDDLIEFLRLGAQMYRGATGPRSTPRKIDDATVKRQLGGWKTAVTGAIQALQDFLNNDPTRTHDLKQAYQDAVRSFVAVAAPQARQTTHEFYQSNRDLIHEWAWPQAEISPGAEELTQHLSVAEARNVRISTMGATIADLDDLFTTKGGTTTIPLPQGVTAHFASDIPASLQHGLSSVAGELAGMTPPALEANSTITLALDLEKFGGDYSAYRFTWVVHHPASGPATQEILIERLGKIGIEALAPSDRAALQKKFDQHNFVRGSGFSDEEFDSVLAAISQIPDAVLTPVDGITFRRVHGASTTDPHAGGEYSPDHHTITMFDLGFTQSMMRTGVPGKGLATESVRAVRHEIGHALDLLPLRQAGAAVDVAEQNLRTAFAQYESPPGSGNYSFPSTEQGNFNHLKQLIIAAQQAEAQARSRSGYRWQANAQGVLEMVQGGTAAAGNEFRVAAQQDGGVRVTHYSDKEWGEYFAESFSLYITDPEALRRLRAHVFAVLQRSFPR